jgi:hypothetical protein
MPIEAEAESHVRTTWDADFLLGELTDRPQTLHLRASE